MKVCLINNLYGKYQKGGAEKVIEKIRYGLIEKEHDVFVISSSPEEEVKEMGVYYIKTRYYNLAKINIFLRLFWHVFDVFDFKTAKKVGGVLEEEKPDLVITNNLKGLSYQIPKQIKKLGLKHYHILHDVQLFFPSGLLTIKNYNTSNSLLYKIYAFINKMLFKNVDRVISPSNWLLEEHLKRGFFTASDTQVLLNPFDKKPPLKKGTRRGSAFNFVFVGQIEQHKGIIELLEASIRLKKSYKNITLQIIGDGSLTTKLKKKYKEEFIVFHGRKDKDDIFKILQSSDCLVMPSLCYENSPTVLYEASVCGLATISSDLGGTREFVSIFGGLLFNHSTPNDLFQKMRLVIKIKKDPKWSLENKEIIDTSIGSYINKLLG